MEKNSYLEGHHRVEIWEEWNWMNRKQQEEGHVKRDTPKDKAQGGKKEGKKNIK